MNALELLKSGYGYKEIKSILECYCSKCLQDVAGNEGAWTNNGNECDQCSR